MELEIGVRRRRTVTTAMVYSWQRYGRLQQLPIHLPSLVFVIDVFRCRIRDVLPTRSARK